MHRPHLIHVPNAQLDVGIGKGEQGTAGGNGAGEEIGDGQRAVGPQAAPPAAAVELEVLDAGVERVAPL